MEIVDDFKFVGTQQEISIPYDIIKVHSSLIAALEEIDPTNRTIVLPTFNVYTEEEVMAALQFILGVIASNPDKPTLKSAVKSTNPLYYGVTRVADDFDQLVLKFHVANQLQMDVFTDEIIDTLSVYIPKIYEIETYMWIGTIARNGNTLIKFGHNVIQVFKNIVTGPDDSNIAILTQLIQNSKLDIVKRYELAVQYALYNIPFPKDIPEVVSARRIWLRLGMVTSPIEYEVQLIQATKEHIQDTSENFKETVRIARDGKCGINTHGYFWFYVTNVTNVTEREDSDGNSPDINLGKVNIYGQSRDIHIRDIMYDIQSIDTRIHIVGMNENIHEFKVEENIKSALNLVLSLQRDSTFLHYLDSKGMLSDIERNFLKTRSDLYLRSQPMIEKATQIMNLYKISDNFADHIRKYDYNVHVDRDYESEVENDDIEVVATSIIGDNSEHSVEDRALSVEECTSITQRLMSKINKLLKILDSHVDFVKDVYAYFSQEQNFYNNEGSTLKTVRHKIKEGFYTNSNNYEGILYVTEAYRIDTINANNIILENLLNPEVRFVTTIPKFDPNLISSDAIYQILKESISKPRIDMYTFDNSDYPAYSGIYFNRHINNTVIYGYTYNTVDKGLPASLFKVSIHSLEYVNDDDIKILDPACIPNIEDIQTNSNPDVKKAVSILAYPWQNPRMYLAPLENNELIQWIYNGDTITGVNTIPIPL
jgi:hypothetical protein